MNRCFYYWKVGFDLTDADQQALRRSGIATLYIRYFDVDWDERKQTIAPVSPVRFRTGVDAALQMVPTVYLTNRTIQHTPDSSIVTLAGRIVTLVEHLSPDARPLGELQLDCDWTETTGARYFNLLRAVRQRLGPAIRLSATIRLHQVKFFDRTGVPPVDRGMLMFYNMGKLADPRTRNSIFDEQTASTYLVNFDRYPLRLDVALPLYSWGVLMRQGRVVALLNDLTVPELASDDRFEQAGRDGFNVTRDSRFRNQSLHQGDRIRIETVDEATCLRAARLIEPYLQSDSLNVSIFHLNPTREILREQPILDDVFAVFRHRSGRLAVP